MPNWKDLLDQVKAAVSSYDIIRREHLKALHQKTGRNVIVYYSGWLQKADLARQVGGFELNDNDKNGCIQTLAGSPAIKIIEGAKRPPSCYRCATRFS